MDGEGTITATAQPASDRRFSPAYRVRVSIANTNEEVLQRLQERWGGTRAPLVRKKGHKQVWRWEVGALQVESFLVQLLPYLIIKRTQAELALQLLETRTVTAPGRGRKLPVEVVEKRAKIVSKIRLLNQRGVVEVPA
jgi:hypothetical protein